MQHSLFGTNNVTQQCEEPLNSKVKHLNVAKAKVEEEKLKNLVIGKLCYTRNLTNFLEIYSTF